MYLVIDLGLNVARYIYILYLILAKTHYLIL